MDDRLLPQEQAFFVASFRSAVYLTTEARFIQE
jgi:hypothetical protein